MSQSKFGIPISLLLAAGAVVICLGIQFHGFWRHATSTRTIVALDLAQNKRIRLIQDFQGEPFDTQLYFDAGDGRWGFYYYDHEDWYWNDAQTEFKGDTVYILRNGRPTIELDTQTGRCVVDRDDGWHCEYLRPVTFRTLDRVHYRPNEPCRRPEQTRAIASCVIFGSSPEQVTRSVDGVMDCVGMGQALYCNNASKMNHCWWFCREYRIENLDRKYRCQAGKMGLPAIHNLIRLQFHFGPCLAKPSTAGWPPVFSNVRCRKLCTRICGASSCLTLAQIHALAATFVFLANHSPVPPDRRRTLG